MSESNKLHIAIFGAGLVGCYLGGLLAHAGCILTLIGRNKPNAELAHEGLTLTHYQRPKIFIPPEKFTFETNPQSVAKADIIILCVKSQDTASAAEALKAFARQDAIIVSAQNGVGNVDVLKSTLTQNIILGSVIPYNVTKSDTSTYHCGTEGGIILEAHHDKRFEKLTRAFRHSGENPKIEPDIKPVQWSKLLMNLNNGINALWGGTLKSGLMQKPYRLALAAMIEEALIITQNAGQEIKQFGKAGPKKSIKTLRLPNFLFGPVMNNILKIDATARSSMLEDLENGKSSEIDYFQGEVIGLAERSGQSAPINRAVLTRVKLAFAAGRSPQMNGRELWKMVKEAQS